MFAAQVAQTGAEFLDHFYGKAGVCFNPLIALADIVINVARTQPVQQAEVMVQTVLQQVPEKAELKFDLGLQVASRESSCEDTTKKRRIKF